MTFCINCGQEIAEDAKFCAYCGKTTDNNTSRSQRRTIYDGEIHKCPNCGEVSGAFVVNCHSCGCEIRGNNTSNSAREFAIRLIIGSCMIGRKKEMIDGRMEWHNGKKPRI